MAEGKTHTPEGHRVDPESEKKYLLINDGGSEVEGDATACEIELWQINAELVKALEAITRLIPAKEVSWIEYATKVQQLAEAALTAAGSKHV